MSKNDLLELVLDHIENCNVFFDFLDAEYLDSLHDMDENDLRKELEFFESFV